MIRVFKLFCKGSFQSLSAIDLFEQAMAAFSPDTFACPICSTQHPDWTLHGSYERNLISFEHGKPVPYRVTVDRYKCASCGSTHAVLPESIIPYQSYSLLFIVAVLNDYFRRVLTVREICAKYDIAVSTLYAWKRLFRTHKRLWLGILEDACTSARHFLTFLSTGERLATLHEFFFLTGYSFLQDRIRWRTPHSFPG